MHGPHITEHLVDSVDSVDSAKSSAEPIALRDVEFCVVDLETTCGRS